MFATKDDAVTWINTFANGFQLEPRKYGKHWRIYDSDGFLLTNDRIGQIEDMADDAYTVRCNVHGLFKEFLREEWARYDIVQKLTAIFLFVSFVHALAWLLYGVIGGCISLLK